MTKNNERRLAEELEKHAAGQEADLPEGLTNVSDSLNQAMRQTHPRPGFINQLAAELQEQRQENASRRSLADLLPGAKRLIAGAVGAAALIAFALFVSNLFSGPPVAPVASDSQTTTALAVNATPTPIATGTPVPPQSGGALSMPQSCIPAQADRQPYVNITAGYCFQYPTNFHVGDVLPDGAPNAQDILALYGPAHDQSLEPLRAAVDIVVAGPTGGRTLQEIVDEEIRTAASDNPVTTEQMTLGGEPAVILSGITCRVPCARLLAVHDDHVYRLTLLSGKQVAADADLVWSSILDTFAFLTPDQLAQFAACPTANAPFVSLTGGYCLNYPTVFRLRQFPGLTQIFTTVPLPAGENAAAAVSEATASLAVERSAVPPDYTLQTLAADLAAQHPDAQIEQGATLGPAPALVIHNPTGLAAGRQLYAHHDGFLYRLTLSPLPGDFPEAAETAEGLWQAAVDSFTFLPSLPTSSPDIANFATLEPPPAIPPTRTPPSPRDFPHHQNAVLVAPADDLPVAQSQFTQLGIDVVPTFDDLQARLQSETVEIIYLHPAVFRSLSPDALRSLYEDGRLIVVLNVPASEINATWPVLSGYDDLEPQHFNSNEQFVAAGFHMYTSASTSGSWTLRDFYPVDSFWYLIHDIELYLQQLPTSGTATPSPPPVPFITPTPFSGTSQPGPTVPPTPPPTPTTPVVQTAPTSVSQAASCSDVPRPALVFHAQIELYRVNVTVLDPLSRAQCAIATEPYTTDALAVSGDALYYPRRAAEAEAITIWRHPLDGDPTPLSFTTTPALSTPWFDLALSPDEQQIVWAASGEQLGAGSDTRFRSTVWLGDLQAGTAMQLWQEDLPATLPVTIEPLYVSPQENVLYFARRTLDIGASGPTPAQYNALYTLSLDGGEPQLLFQCQDDFKFCLHDVDFARRLLTTITGVDDRPELRIVDFDGAVVASYAPPGDSYIAQPIFSPAGDVAFIMADLQESEQGTIVFQRGAIHLLTPPYTGEPRELLATTGIYFELWRWFDGDSLLATNLAGSQGIVLVPLDGDPIPIPESRAANPLAVLRE